MNRIKNAIVLLILTLSFMICSASPEPVLILVNGEDDPILAPNQNIMFSWDWGGSEGCEPPGNSEARIPVLHLIWHNESSNKWEPVEDSPFNHPDNPLFIEGGFSEEGDYVVTVPWHRRQSDNCFPVIYSGSFSIEEDYEFECPGDGHGPYSGKTFMTHTTTLKIVTEAI